MENRMETFITLKTFTYPSEAYILRGKLESEGIECFIKDELTIQSNPLYSNAIGGVKLQVKESDFNQAVEILKLGGYMLDDDSQPANIFNTIARRTLKIPLLNLLPDLFRVLIVFVLTILVSVFAIAFIVLFLRDQLTF